MKFFLSVLLVLLLPAGFAQAQVAQGQQFTYQGRLQQAGQPASGPADLVFALFDAASGGNQIGSTVSRPQTPVTAGLFSVELQFPGAFSGEKRWLQISVNGQTLSPRQAVNAAPVALYALNGNEGPAGPQGLPGEDGAPGAPGAQGIQGIPGNDGAPGAQGLQGIPGNDGAPGAQGLQGIPGNDGAPGAQGLQGIPGNDGAPGAQGIQGVPGNDGAPGAQGIQGVPGNDGAPGPQGIQGIQGIPGNDGAPGADFPDAPVDGGLYARRNGAWEMINDDGSPSLMAEILTDSPTLYYPLDEPAGSTSFVDLGSAGIDVAFSGSPVTLRPGYSRLFPTSDANYLRLLEGNGKASAVGNPTGLATPSGAITVEAIYSPATNGADNQPWLYIGDGGGSDPLLWFGVLNLQPRIVVGAQTRVDLAGLYAGRTYHVAAVVDPSLCQVRFYVNGRLLQVQGNCGFSGTLVAPSVYVASAPDQLRPFVYSTLGHVAFYYGQALSEARIAAHAKAAGLYGH